MSLSAVFRTTEMVLFNDRFEWAGWPCPKRRQGYTRKHLEIRELHAAQHDKPSVYVLEAQRQGVALWEWHPSSGQVRQVAGAEASWEAALARLHMENCRPVRRLWQSLLVDAYECTR